MPADLNNFIKRLPEEDRAHLLAASRPVDLELGDIIHSPGDLVERVVWVNAGLLSVVSSDMEGQSVETNMVGREGSSGVLEACGSRISFMTVLVQVEGQGLSTPPAVCRDLFGRSPGFRDAVVRYAEVMSAEGRQSVVCQARHSVESRCARWLLETADRSGLGERLPLTQEYLASMLGVQRTTVTGVAKGLQRQELIRYSRGMIDITDRAGLEAAACACRTAIKEHRDRVYAG